MYWSTADGSRRCLGPPHLVVSFRRSWEGFHGTVVQGPLCGKTMYLARLSGSDCTLVIGVRAHSECWDVEVIGQDWSGEVVALFLEDWELGWVALSCHMAIDSLCQEMRDACWDTSELLGSQCSLCSNCLEDSVAEEWEGREPGKSTVAARKSLSLWTGCDRKECGERIKGRSVGDRKFRKVYLFWCLLFVC